MKMNWQTNVFLTAALFVLPAVPATAQDNTNSTNDVPTLKQLMSTNSVVTNTVGVVLVKISPSLWAGKFETTQDAYQQVMHGNPSAFRRRAKTGGLGQLGRCDGLLRQTDSQGKITVAGRLQLQSADAGTMGYSRCRRLAQGRRHEIQQSQPSPQRHRWAAWDRTAWDFTTCGEM